MHPRYTEAMEGDGSLIRPVSADDLDAVLELTRRGGTGLTNLPPDRDALERRIASAEQALSDQQARADGAAIMLVAELAGRIAATGMIFARVGAEWPFYSYRITRQASLSRAVGRSKSQRLLNLVNDFDGETEVGGLFVDPAMRGQALGQLMARARYMFIAAHRGWFGERVIAELRGYQDESGGSPVWEAIGRHFYDMEFEEADRTGAIHGNQFIADLGPRYPIYISMLPAEAQAALGRPHNDGRPAHAMLLAEGFRDEGYVDIFDGGPTLVAPIDSVRTVAHSCEAAFFEEGEGGSRALIATGFGSEFRLARGTAQARGERVTLDPATARLLSVSEGDTLRIALLETA
ncbi:arginine N-succinyltransferase [Tsuneonella sp. HG249]